jgi:hypothetical protein
MISGRHSLSSILYLKKLQIYCRQWPNTNFRANEGKRALQYRSGRGKIYRVNIRVHKINGGNYLHPDITVHYTV